MKILGNLKYRSHDSDTENVLALGLDALEGSTQYSTKPMKSIAIGLNAGKGVPVNEAIIIGNSPSDLDFNFNRESTVIGNKIFVGCSSSSYFQDSVILGSNTLSHSSETGKSYTAYGSVYVGNNVFKDASIASSFTSGSVFLGYNAFRGSSDINASNATFIGAESGRDATGAFNGTVAVGYWAMRQVNAAKEIVAIGGSAGYQSGDDCQYNVYFGYQAGRLTTGDYNLVIGAEIGQILSGDGNILLSNKRTSIEFSQSSSAEIVGDNNIILGTVAGNFDETLATDSSIAIGEGAGYLAAGYGNIFLGNGAGRNKTAGKTLQVGHTAKEYEEKSLVINVSQHDTQYIVPSTPAEIASVDALIAGLGGTIKLLSYDTDTGYSFVDDGNDDGYGSYNERFTDPTNSSNNLRLNDDDGTTKFIGTIDGTTVGESGIATVTINYREEVGVGTATITADMDSKKMSLHSDDAGDVALTVNGTDGIKVPSGTTAERPTGDNGIIRYNSDLNAVEVHQNGVWEALSGVSSLKETLEGDAATDTFNIAHTFNTTDLAIEVIEVSTGETVYPRVRRTTTTNVEVYFNVAPAVSEDYRVIIRKF